MGEADGSCAIDLDATADMNAPKEVLFLRVLFEAADDASREYSRTSNTARVMIRVNYTSEVRTGIIDLECYRTQVESIGCFFEIVMRHTRAKYHDFKVTAVDIIEQSC